MQDRNLRLYTGRCGLAAIATLLLALAQTGCGAGAPPEGPISYALTLPDPLAHSALAGDIGPVRDPSIIRQGASYYLFSTDVYGPTNGGYLPIRCSPDAVTWSACGNVLPALPAWAVARVDGLRGLWAPDISYFGGLYHLYYSGSTLYGQRSVIGFATNVTLDAADPKYRWVDGGEVIESSFGTDFNAIDPNILANTDGRVYLTYGSYWSGIFQLELDPATGHPLPNAPRIQLARRQGTPADAIEGSSLVRHGRFYYLFVSLDACCDPDPNRNNYKQAVGRGTSPSGPFLDMAGTPMLGGGATVLLEGDSAWNSPGGGSAYVDRATGESLLVFHASRLSEGRAPYLWLKHLSWVQDWPGLL